MQSLKSAFGLIRVLLPVLYCGYLVYYFIDTSGSVQEAQDIGLGPTLFGLGAVGLLFNVPVVLKIIRMFSGPRSPGSGKGGGQDPLPDGDDGGSNADAAIARYMAQRATEEPPSAAPVPPVKQAAIRAQAVQTDHGPAERPTFGRKSK